MVDLDRLGRCRPRRDPAHYRNPSTGGATVISTRTPIDIAWPRVLLVALVAALVVGGGFFAFTTGAAFDPFNPSWAGTSDFTTQLEDDGLDVTYVTDTAEYDDLEANGTVAYVFAPDDGVQPDAHVADFVRAGGTLVVLADGRDTGNALIESTGATTRFDGDLLRDEQHHDEAPTMPIATGVENHTLTTGVDQLTLNYGSALEPGNATVLVRSSEFGYLTANESASIEDAAELGAHPVATVESIGAGDVIAVSDPSIAIDAMLDRDDNAQFLANTYQEEDRAVIDLAHGGSMPPLTAVVLTVRGSPWVQAGLGLALVAGVLLAGEWLSRRRDAATLFERFQDTTRLPGPLASLRGQADSTGPLLTDEQRAAYLRQTHPEWDEERIERVIAALNQRGEKQEDEH